MSSQIELVKLVASILSCVEGEVGKLVLHKPEKLLYKKSGLDTTCKIADVLSGRKYFLDEEMETGNISCLYY